MTATISNTDTMSAHSPKRTKRKRITPDWEAIQREYRVGRFSIREIARQFGCQEKSIRRRIKNEGWVKDLSKEYREALDQELISGESPQTLGREAIEKAAKEGASVVRIHRKDVRQQLEVVNRLIGLVKGFLEEPKEGMTPEKMRVYGGVVRDSSHALSKLVQAERQAYGMDSKVEGNDQALPEVSEEDRDHLKEVAKQAARKVLDEGKQTLKLVS